MLLLDTCTLLWLVGDQQKLSSTAKKIISKKSGSLFVSAISAFEIGIKLQKKKLQLPLPLLTWFPESLNLHGLKELPVTAEIAAMSTILPAIHSDPSDRILIATAQVHRLTILTPDTHLQQYPTIKWIW